MRARVINYPSGPVVAFGGFEYVNYEWRDIPPGFENQAGVHPYLEIEPEPVKPAPKPKAKPVVKKTTTRRRRATKPKASK